MRGEIHTMSSLATRLSLLSVILLTATAHSHIDYILVNGVSYSGFIPTTGSVNSNDVVGWSTTATDDGFVPPSNYTTPDIVCHRDGTPPRAHVPASPGDKIHLQWNGWPQSHNGPIQSYLARCDSSNTNASDGCASVDKMKLEFSKIDDSAPVFLNESGGPPGSWATEILIANNNSWLIEVPRGLRPGPYVLRHEIIALHYANATNGAQNYPQCFNLWVAEGSANSTEITNAMGTLATDMYHENDPGILIDIYQNMTTYKIPGPTLASNAVPIPMSSQTNMLSRVVGTPVSVLGSITRPFSPTSTTNASKGPL